MLLASLILLTSTVSSGVALGMARDAAAPPMVVVNESDVRVEEPPPHGKIGMSTAYRISDAAPERTMEFRKRDLHPGAAIGVHAISHDEVYYVLSGTGIVHSDGVEKAIGQGDAAYLYRGASVGVRQTGAEPLSLIISYPVTAETLKD